MHNNVTSVLKIVFRWFWITAILLSPLSTATAWAKSTPPVGSGSASESSTAPESASGPRPQRVKIGVYLRNVESVDMQSNTYFLDLLLWVKWKGDIDPTKTLRIVNAIDTWGLTMTPAYETPKKLADGDFYQRYSVEGRFYHKFWLGTYPLDWQKVTLELEDTEHVAGELVFVPDEESGKMSDHLQIPGWRIDKVYNEVQEVVHPTDYGMGERTQERRTFSHYRCGLKLYRPASFFLLKMVPPMVIVVLCCFIVFFLHPDHVDARISTVITALLTQVFLQLTFTSSLPNLSILVLLDQIFNCSYFIMFLILVECVIVNRLNDRRQRLTERVEATEGAEKQGHTVDMERVALAIRRLDRTSMVLFPVLYLTSCFLLALVSRGRELFSVFAQ